MPRALPIAAYDEAYAGQNPLIGQPFEVRLGVYLWRSSLTEQIATATFQKLARWSRLSEAEQATARLFAEQERNHAELLHALGREWLTERPDRFLRPLHVPEEPWLLLAGVHQAERISLAGFGHMAALGRQMGHGVLTAVYELILREERAHLAWGQPLVRRLIRDPAIGPGMQAYRRLHPIAREYRAVREERPWAGVLRAEGEEGGQDQVDGDVGAERLDLGGPLGRRHPGEGGQVRAPLGQRGGGGVRGPEDVGQGDHGGSLP